VATYSTAGVTKLFVQRPLYFRYDTLASCSYQKRGGCTRLHRLDQGIPITGLKTVGGPKVTEAAGNYAAKKRAISADVKNETLDA
jgi:hypothetical protein